MQLQVTWIWVYIASGMKKEKLDFLTRELKGKRPLVPPTIGVIADDKEVWDTFRLAVEIGRDSFGAYAISMVSNASDVLAVELLQKDARLAVRGELGRPFSGGTLEVVPLFETVKDSRGVLLGSGGCIMIGRTSDGHMSLSTCLKMSRSVEVHVSVSIVPPGPPITYS